MGSGEDKVKEAEAGQGKERVLDARLRELEEFLNGEFHKRVKDFWPDALKLYLNKVVNIFDLEEEFGRIWKAIAGQPFFYTELYYNSMRGLHSEFERPGVYPLSVRYYGNFEIQYFKGVCVVFYNAWVLEVGDTERKKTGFIVLDFREARVRRCSVY
jgi:hypothetical protein